MLDWDTWRDDPARAAGHLLPDAIAAFFTAGTGTLATRGAKAGLDGADALEDLASGLRHVDLDSLPSYHDPANGTIDPRARDLVPDDFDLYGGKSRQEFYDEHWDFVKNDWSYPERNGFEGEARPNTLRGDPEHGPVIDRFGNPDGNFASPAGTPYPDRAVPPTSLTNEYHQYRVAKDLPPEVTEGKIAEAFGQKGGGTQYHFDKPMQYYIDEGYLVEVK